VWRQNNDTHKFIKFISKAQKLKILHHVDVNKRQYCVLLYDTEIL